MQIQTKRGRRSPEQGHVENSRQNRSEPPGFQQLNMGASVGSQMGVDWLPRETQSDLSLKIRAS